MNLGTENEYQEFKTSLGQLDKGLKSLSAMLNRHGRATVYFGVDDNGTVCGLKSNDKILMDIRTRVSSKIKPQILADITELEDEGGKTYIKVTATGSDTPYSFDGRYYIRNVSSDVQATNDVLRKLLTSSDTDILRQMPSPFQDLTFNTLVETFCENGLEQINTNAIFSNYGLLNKELMFNMNAYLLSDNNEHPINLITYYGNNIRDPFQISDFGGKSILSSFQEVLDFFFNMNELNTDTSSRETHLFDYPSFREAWTNACIHNAWHLGTAPSIHLFNDRIEILSYGRLPIGVSKESFVMGACSPINTSLQKSFMAAGFSKQSGHGILTIVRKYGIQAFYFKEGIIKVIIPFAFERLSVTARKRYSQIIEHKPFTRENVFYTLSNDGSMTIMEAFQPFENGFYISHCLKIKY